MVDPVTAGAAVLSGIKLVKQSVDFIKSNINTCKDVGEIIGHVEKAFEGEKQCLRDREKKGADPFATENVAEEIINAKIAQEQLYELSQIVDLRFGHGTWKYILSERKRRIDERKEKIKEAKIKARRKKQEMMDNVRMVSIGIVIIVFVCIVFGVGIMLLASKNFIVYAHEQPSLKHTPYCLLYDPKYFIICMSEGRGYADTQLYLDYKKEREKWIIDNSK